MAGRPNKAYCQSGKNCFTCKFPDCTYNGHTALDPSGRGERPAGYGTHKRKEDPVKKAARGKAYRERYRAMLGEKQGILKKLRKAAGLTQMQLGQLIGVSFTTIKLWERGESPWDLQLLATVFPELAELKDDTNK